MTTLSFGTSPLVITVGLLLWLVGAWLCWANWTRNGRRRSAGFLEGIRFLLITLLVFTFFKPEFVQQIKRSEKPEVLVLVDQSRSMETRDVQLTNGLFSRSDWLTQQVQQQPWKALEKTSRVSVEKFGDPTNQYAGTDFSAPLEKALNTYQNLRAVLLLSDGDWTDGKNPAGTAVRYREQEVPLFTVGLGSDQYMPDVVLENVNAPSYSLFGEQVAIPFKIRSHLREPVKTTVILKDEKQEEVRKEVTIPPLGDLQDAISWYPRSTGENKLTLQFPAIQGETQTNNNSKEFQIAVRVETLKVLVVDSLPRWEYRFLRNALARDPGVEMNSILFHPGMGAGGGFRYLSSFPATKEAISKYDVIFLGDIGIGGEELTPQDAELIKGLVEQQGSGLVFLPGRRGRQLTFTNSPLQDLLPVTFDATKPQGYGMENEAALHLTSFGKRHLLTRFDADENRNDEIWKLLPGYFWSAALEKSRPGSDVLGVHSAVRNEWGRSPLLTTRNAGNGKVLFMGTDSAWRWRRGVEDKFHYRFWSQVVRWMAHQRHLSAKEGIRLTYSPETPQAGSGVYLQATVLDRSGFPVESGSVVAKIVSPSGKTERVDFSMVEGGWGVFKSAFTPREEGDYKIEVNAPSEDRTLNSAINVARQVREKIGQPANLALMREFAEISKGSSGTVTNLAQIISEMSVLPEPKPLERRLRVWANPWWGAALLILLAAYWTGRKVAGMI